MSKINSKGRFGEKMNSEIKVTYELRPCYVGSEKKKKALFHSWTNDGNAIVELEDGSCTTYASFAIQFVSPKINNYCFENQN